MAANGNIGNGTRVSYRSGSPGSYTDIGQIMDVTGFEQSSDDVDTTVHTAAGRMKTSIPGMIKISAMELKLLYDPEAADHQALENFARTQEDLWFYFEVPAESTRTRFKTREFQGRIGAFNSVQPIDDVVTATVSISVISEITDYGVLTP